MLRKCIGLPTISWVSRSAFMFDYQGVELLSLGSLETGAILLAGPFLYDIFWVFFTTIMVSVAKSFDAPIKLLFPTADLRRPFIMLGLGDIVIPGETRKFSCLDCLLV